jgi:hypothetical protein
MDDITHGSLSRLVDSTPPRIVFSTRQGIWRACLPGSRFLAQSYYLFAESFCFFEPLRDITQDCPNALQSAIRVAIRENREFD